MKFQSLNHVCNGGHIYDLPFNYIGGAAYFSTDELLATMKKETKAILIVSTDGDQESARSMLRKLSKKKKGLRARRLCKWSGTADLWIVRQ